MRLLNARTRMFEEFYADTPDYAILSHTWEQEEVIHADMIALQKDPSSEVQRKVGFQKIEMMCRKALEDKLSYVWIDTCCIDKTSSAELSEAINSMYRWYGEARVCYAYLADVPADFRAFEDLAGDQILSDEGYEKLLDSRFARSRWFTRGWTLQELIAPSEVKFYNQDFGYIGTKESLADIIQRITGIDAALLIGEQPLDAFCVARKMSWAATRKTTRLEDTAYSLFGIFDVNMPLLYGEGKRAFQRLQEEIIRTCDDDSILAWERTSRSERAILAPEPLNFAKCGRVVRWTIPGASQTPLPIRTKFNLRLPLVKFGRGTENALAVIGCRYEDNFAGPICLRLKERFLHEKPYTLVQTQPYLVVGPWGEIESAHFKDVTIADIYEPKAVAATARFHWEERNLKCWVTFVGNNEQFRIAQAHPSRYWNTETNLFMPPQESFVSAGAHFVRGDGINFLLNFGYLREKASGIHNRFYKEFVCLTKPVGGHVEEQLSSSEASSQGERAISQLRLQGKGVVNNIEASIVKTEVMGEMIFLIKIKIREGKVRRFLS